MTVYNTHSVTLCCRLTVLQCNWYTVTLGVRGGGGVAGLCVRMESPSPLPTTAPTAHVAHNCSLLPLLASMILPALMGFTTTQSQTATFVGCCPPHLMWDIVTKGQSYTDRGGGGRAPALLIPWDGSLPRMH